ncbi:hypothetical protein M441DRAFT_340886 [Trichoderma asperellum CBS 433.97]|uniref:Uncharacterized protein n=1 Tax=Trichoderma asperellum (strain ATCC 204424 / CBS 433.97 / NBRC 101777) TaxID=1042311 RepID=A0A2T3ZGY8_TRIA4|nr:hypothetical protein M441DRAFT_340886 [Trichoderma asperellum CBS 433.97]PTB44074.1 hypothetical protein M441DRAFT_340886 [Trichoderma asperellum CBS 433.97]
MSESLIDFRSLVDSYDFAPDGQEKFNTLFGLLDKAIGSSTSGTDANEAVANGIDEISNRDEPEGFLWTLWTLLIEISKRIPLDDSRAQSLVEITQKLKAKQSATVEVWGSTYSLWTDMPLFGAVMREAWNATPTFDNSLGDATTIAQWKSLNSFAARLLGSSVQSWTNFALWELRQGLEEPLSSQQAKDTYLITTSEWITHAGKVLYDEGRKGAQLDEDDVRALRTGSLLKGEASGFSEVRWRFWKKKIEELSVEAGAEAKKRAEKALEVIKSLEA